MSLATGNVINRDNSRGISYPPGVLFTQVVGYIFIDPEEPPQLAMSRFALYRDESVSLRSWQRKIVNVIIRPAERVAQPSHHLVCNGEISKLRL